MCRVFDSVALLMSCVVIFVGQLKQLMLTVVHWPTTTAFLSVVCRIGRKYLCFGDFLPMRTLCDASHKELESQ